MQKNLAASGILLLLLFGASRHLAKEKAVLESRVEAVRQSYLVLESGHSRSRRQRERTVGDLLREYGGPMTARELIQAWSYSANQNGLETWKIYSFYLSQRSFDELLELDFFLRQEDGPGEARRSLLRSVHSLIHQSLKNDRGRFFDHVVRAGNSVRNTKEYFSQWVEEEPEAAIDWFRSLEWNSDKNEGALSRQSPRNEFRAILLSQLTKTDLNSAIVLLKEENALGKSFTLPGDFSLALIEQASASGDDSLLVELLKSNQSNHLILDSDSFLDSPFWVALTETTGDPDRSVELLQSLDKPHGYGEAMAQIISSQTELPIREQIEWLGARIEDQGNLDRGVIRLLDQRFGFAAFSENGSLSKEALHWLDSQSQVGSGESFLSSLAASYSRTGGHLRAWEIAARLSPTEANETQLLEYGRLLYTNDKAGAIRVLPPELVEKFSNNG